MDENRPQWYYCAGVWRVLKIIFTCGDLKNHFATHDFFRCHTREKNWAREGILINNISGSKNSKKIYFYI
jgi:hypothetical protein